jgi:hypothetical protein
MDGNGKVWRREEGHSLYNPAFVDFIHGDDRKLKLSTCARILSTSRSDAPINLYTAALPKMRN